MPLPPRTNDGRTRTGKPILSAMTFAPAKFVAVPLAGASKLAFSKIFEKDPLSSARSIASGEVPRIGTPAFNKPWASPSAV